MKKLLLFAIFVLALASQSIAEPLASAEIKGELIPLPEDLDAIAEASPKDLLNVVYGKYDGPQNRIGVLDVENTSSSGSFPVGFGNWSSANYSDFNQVPVSGIDAMITDILNSTGRFRIVEREVLDNLLDEQDLGASGRVAQPSAAKIGNVLGAKTFIKAEVTAYEPNFKGNSVGLGGLTGGLLGGLKVGGSKSRVQMAFRLIDAETSEVTFTKQVSVVMSSSSLGVGGGGWGGGSALGGAFESYSKAPIGQAVIVAVNVGVYNLIKEIGLDPTEGSVVQVSENGRIVINLGEGAVEVGDTFHAISKGEEFIDPDTGLSLGGTETVVGNVKIVQVQEKFSFGEAVDFDAQGLSRGSKLVSTAPVSEIEYGDAWNLKGKRSRR